MSWDLILLVIAGAVTVALAGEGLLIAIDWLTERSGRRPQAVEPLGMRIARLEHDCALEPPFEHPAGCPGCRVHRDPNGALVWPQATVDALGRPLRLPGGVIRTGSLSANEVRRLHEQYAGDAFFVLGEGALWSPTPESKAPPGTFRR